MNPTDAILWSLDTQHPLIIMLIGGTLGGMTAIAFDFYDGNLSRRSIAHLLFGIVAALTVTLLNLVPGNAGVLLTSLTTGIGGAFALRQFLSSRRKDDSVVSSVEIQAQIESDIKRYELTFDQISNTLQADLKPREVVRSIQVIMHSSQKQESYKETTE